MWKKIWMNSIRPMKLTNRQFLSSIFFLSINLLTFFLQLMSSALSKKSLDRFVWFCHWIDGSNFLYWRMHCSICLPLESEKRVVNLGFFFLSFHFWLIGSIFEGKQRQHAHFLQWSPWIYFSVRKIFYFTHILIFREFIVWLRIVLSV